MTTPDAALDGTAPSDVDPPVFDGHNDTLLRLTEAGGPVALDAFASGGPHALDLPKARAGGFAGGLFAIWVPSPGALGVEDPPGPYDHPLPGALDRAGAETWTLAQAELLVEMDRRGDVALCRTAAEIRAAMAAGRLAAVMHLEGADGIGADLALLDTLHGMGLRSLGPVWSRPTVFGVGVPNRFPAGPDIGPGLTEAGQALVRRCNDLRIVIDLSHLNEAGMRDVARISTAPLVASHSNPHRLSAHARNLTDDQLAMIRDSDGLVGVNFCAAFLREDGRRSADIPVERVVEHIDALMESLGEDRVGLGSDYDGALMPEALKTAAGLPALRGAMRARGYPEALMAKICHGNWLALLERTWGA